MVGASGSEVACTLDTNAAPNKPAADERRKCLREFIVPPLQ
jgi:hypothetical protein